MSTTVTYIHGFNCSSLKLKKFSVSEVLNHMEITREHIDEAEHDRESGGDNEMDLVVTQNINHVVVAVSNYNGEIFHYVGNAEDFVGEE